MSKRDVAPYAGLKEGDKVLCEGFEGRIMRLCEWTDMMVDVRLDRGVCCVDARYLVRR